MDDLSMIQSSKFYTGWYSQKLMRSDVSTSPGKNMRSGYITRVRFTASYLRLDIFSSLGSTASLVL